MEKRKDFSWSHKRSKGLGLGMSLMCSPKSEVVETEKTDVNKRSLDLFL